MSFMLKVKRLSPDAILPTVAHPGEDIGLVPQVRPSVGLTWGHCGRTEIVS